MGIETESFRLVHNTLPPLLIKSTDPVPVRTVKNNMFSTVQNLKPNIKIFNIFSEHSKSCKWDLAVLQWFHCVPKLYQTGTYPEGFCY